MVEKRSEATKICNYSVIVQWDYPKRSRMAQKWGKMITISFYSFFHHKLSSLSLSFLACSCINQRFNPCLMFTLAELNINIVYSPNRNFCDSKIQRIQLIVCAKLNDSPESGYFVHFHTNFAGPFVHFVLVVTK